MCRGNADIVHVDMEVIEHLKVILLLVSRLNTISIADGITS
jgi:hypothetical protein